MKSPLSSSGPAQMLRTWVRGDREWMTSHVVFSLHACMHASILGRVVSTRENIQFDSLVPTVETPPERFQGMGDVLAVEKDSKICGGGRLYHFYGRRELIIAK